MAKEKDGIYKCSKCGCEEFYREKTGTKRCVKCQKERMKKIYASDAYKSKHRASDRFRRRGCTEAQYNERMQKQAGKCEICGKELWQELRIDHDHKSGALRGLLCDKCNLGIGHFADSPDVLRKAAQYLEKYTNS
jgi:hypothetical protein